MGNNLTYETNELQHYGVLGMKWGVRRNPTKAYIKASKKRDRLNKWVVAKNSALNKLKGQAEKQRKYTEAQKNNLELSRARRDYDAGSLDIAKKKYGDGRYDVFGIKKSNVIKAQKKFDESDNAYNEQKRRTDKAILDSNAANKRVTSMAAEAKRRLQKSEKWQTAMDKAFKDVPPEVIRAGEAYFENRKKK